MGIERARGGVRNSPYQLRRKARKQNTVGFFMELLAVEPNFAPSEEVVCVLSSASFLESA